MIKHNIWSVSIICLLFVLLFTPLIVSSSLYFPFVTGKVFAFRAIMTLVVAAWLVLVIARPYYLPKKSVLLAVSGLFVAWLAIANIFGIDRTNSFLSNFERMEGWFTHAYLFAYLVIASSVLKTERVWNWFLGASVAIANFLALWAAFDTVSRTSVFLGNSTYVAIYMLFNFYFAALLLFRLYEKAAQETALKSFGYIYYVLSMVLFIYVIFRTQTRGTVLALVFSAVGFFALSAVSHWENKKVRIVSIVLFVAAMLGGSLFWVNREAAWIQANPLLSRVATISASEGTGRARVMNWKIALDGIKERPLMGWGQENYTYVFSKHYNPEMYAQEPWFDRTHNAFLDWTIQGGVIALVLYLALFGFAVYGIHKSVTLARTEKNILVSLLAGYAVHNLFVFDNYSSYLMFFTVLAFTVHHSQKDTLALEKVSVPMRQVGASVGIAVLVFASWFVIVQPYTVARALIKAYEMEDAELVFKVYTDAIDKHTFGTFEAMTRFMTSGPNFLQIQNDEFKKKYLAATDAYGQQILTERPLDVRAQEFYGTFLLQTGNLAKALEVLEHVRQLSPDRQNNLYVLGFTYVNLGRFSEAVEIFGHAYEVAPSNQKAKNYYGAALLLDKDASGWEFVEGYDYQDPFFLSVFKKIGSYKESIKILERQVKDDPLNYQAQVTLAVAYVYDGQRAKAVQTIQAVQKAVPEFKGQGDQLIKDINAGRTPGK